MGSGVVNTAWQNEHNGSGSLDPLDLYYREVRGYPVLKASEERLLFTKLEACRERRRGIVLALPGAIAAVAEEASSGEGEKDPLVMAQLERAAQRFEEQGRHLARLRGHGGFARGREVVELRRRVLAAYRVLGIVGRREDEVFARVERHSLLWRPPAWISAAVAQAEVLRARIGELEEEAVTCNLRLAMSVARRYAGAARNMTVLDLAQEANLGLMTAVEKYDVTLGYKFSTFAVWWIRQAVRRAIDFQDRVIRRPSHIIQKGLRIRKAMDGIDGAALLGTERRKDMERARQLFEEPVSLDLLVGPDKETRFGEFLVADGRSPWDEAIEALRREKTRALTAGLSERDGRLMRLRLGVEDGTERPRKELGAIFRLSRERVRQVEDKAVALMHLAAVKRGWAGSHNPELVAQGAKEEAAARRRGVRAAQAGRA